MSVSRSTGFFVLALAGFSAAAAAQSDPRALPPANLSGVQGAGSWTYDWPDGAGGDLSHGGGALGVSEDGKYLYISCVQDHSGIAKLEIPAAGGRARVVAPCLGPNKAEIAKIHPDPNAFRPMLGGVLELNGRVTVTGYISYDANGQTFASHWSGPSLSSLSGPFAASVLPGMVKSQMASIPQEWRALLGGPALSSAGYTSIISRASYGASVSVFDPAAVTANGFPMTMLLGCPHAVASCLTYGTPTSNDYNGSELSGGFFIVPGTRTLVVLERESSGPTCYGYATRTAAEHGQPYLDAVKCYSLSDQLDQKGPKGYPYRLVAKLYDVNDLAAVRQGTKKPWDIRQYATIDLPGSSPGEYVTSGAYNPVRGEFYLLRYSGGGVNTVYVYTGFGSNGVAPPTSTTVTPAVTPVAEVCGDDIDNDLDGLVDEGCTAPTPEVCGDLLDNDQDGLVDEGCVQPLVEVCGDTIDNDGDGEVNEGCPTPVARPGAPVRLSSFVNRKTVAFRWSRPLTGGAVTDYVLEAGLAPGTTFYAASVGAVTSVSVPNVGTGRYYVRVRARNANGAGAASREVIVSVGCRTGPRQVSSLRAITMGGLVKLTWTDPDGCSGTSYEVALTPASASAAVAADAPAVRTGAAVQSAAAPQVLATDEPQATTYLTAGTYVARVRTRSDVGVGEIAETQFTVGGNNCPAPQHHLKLRTVVAGRRLGLFWTPLDPEVVAEDDAQAPVSYAIEAGSAPGASDIGVLPMGRAAQFITNAPPGVYYVRVRAGNTCGGGLASNEARLVVR